MKHSALTTLINQSVTNKTFTHNNGAAQIHLGDTFNFANIWANTAKIIMTDSPYLIPSGGSNLTRKVKQSKAPNKGVMAGYNNNGEVVYCKTNWPEIMQFLYLIAAQDSECFVFTNTSCLTQSILAAHNAGFKQHNAIVWDKRRTMPTRNRMKAVEIILYLYKGRSRDANHHSRTNLIAYRCNRQTDHRTEKPVELMADLVTNHSNTGDTIFDPFLGSGTTAIAALQNNRNIIGAEITKKYFITTIKRILQTPPNINPNQVDLFDLIGA